MTFHCRSERQPLSPPSLSLPLSYTHVCMQKFAIPIQWNRQEHSIGKLKWTKPKRTTEWELHCHRNSSYSIQTIQTHTTSVAYCIEQLGIFSRNELSDFKAIRYTYWSGVLINAREPFAMHLICWISKMLICVNGNWNRLVQLLKILIPDETKIE